MKRISLCIIASVALSLMVGLAGAGVASAAVGQQLLSNAGVESGSTSPDGWNSAYWGDGITAALTWSNDAHTGSHSLKAEITAYGTQGDAKWWPQPVSVTGGAYYALSDWYKSDIPSAVSVEYWTSGQDTNKDGTWVNLYSDIAPSPDTWTQYQTGFTMPSTAVKAIFVHFIAGVGWLETDDYAMTEQSAPAGFSSPTISLTFDDGSNTFYNGNANDNDTAYYMLNRKGFKATTYIPTSLIGTTDYMSNDQISFIARAGYEIGSHSVSHGDLTTISDDSALSSEFTTSKSTLEAISGVGSGAVTDFAYPFGTYNARVVDKEQAAGYATGRSVEAGFNSKADVQAYDIRVQNMTPDVTLDQFKSWVNYAKDHNYWLVIVYHRIIESPFYGSPPRCSGSSTNGCLGPYDVASRDFQSQLDYISTARLDSNVKTVKSALATLAPQAPPSSGTVKLTPSNPTINATVTATPTGFSSLDHTALTYTYSWKINGVAVTGATGPTLDLSQANVKRGDTITAEVYAKEAGNGLTSTTASTSAAVANAAPVKGSVDLAPQAPKAGDTLTAAASGFSDIDGDSLTHQYTWYVNGNVVAGATGSTLQLTTAVGGDIVAVEVRDVDGHGGVSDAATASVTVANTAPVKGSVTVTPSSPQVGTALTATPTGFTDVDKDTLSYHYQWSINGTPVPGATDATFIPTSSRGDVVAVSALADDGHGGTSAAADGSVTLVNTPPVKGSVAITPVSPKVGSTLTATPTGFTDADADSLTYHYQWSINGTAVTGATGATFALTTAVRGNLVAVSVSADDGNQGTTETVSSNVTVDNTAPSKGSAAITPLSPKAGAVLTAAAAGFTDVDGDQLTYHYQWSVNGTAVPGATGATYTLTTAVRGNEVGVAVTADDGRQGISDIAAASVAVADTAPIKGSVAITPAPPKAGAVLTATPAGFTDVDRDPLAYHYQWSVNGTAVPGATGSTYSLTTAVHGDVVAVTALADDGYGGTSDSAGANVTLVNTPPVVGSVSITPSSPGVGATLTATPAGFVDADRDALSYHYQWSVHGTEVNGATDKTFTPTAIRGENVSVAVWADDGQGEETARVSKTVVVGNVAPTAGQAAITPPSPTTDAMLSATHTEFVDPDGDALKYTYQWSVNGTAVDGATSETFDLSQAGHGDHGDTVALTVTADDGFAGGKTDASTSVTVANTPPVKGSVTISPSSPQAGTTLTVAPTGFADGDGDGLSYQYAWFHNGQQIAGATGATLAGSAVTAGEIRVDVRATDGHGGTSDAATVTVTASNPPATDTVAPTVAVSSPLARAYWVGLMLPVRFSCSDSSGVASCTATIGRVGGKATVVHNGQKVRLASLGRYVLQITAKDPAGNTASKSVIFRTTSDRVAPKIRITSPLAQAYRSGQMLAVRFACSDSAGIASCKATLGRVGGKPATVSSGKKVRLATVGRYALRITATDRNDNAATKTLYFSAKR